MCGKSEYRVIPSTDSSGPIRIRAMVTCTEDHAEGEAHYDSAYNFEWTDEDEAA